MKNLKERGVEFIYKYIILGKGLNNSFTNIFSKIQKKELPSPEDFGEITGALIKRFTRVWGISILITTIPTLLTFWILFNQNSILKEQTDFFRFQFENEQVAKNTQMLITNSKNSPTQRQNALISLIEVLKNQQIGKRKAYLNFRFANLSNVNLTSVKLDSLDFKNATFTDSELNDQLITNCNFQGSQFLRTNLRNSEFQNCNFEEVHFGRTSISAFRNIPGQHNVTLFTLPIKYKGKMNNVKFINSKFDGTHLGFCDLRESEFQNISWDLNSITEDLVYGAIFLGVKGLNSELLQKLKKSNAIVDKDSLIHFLKNAKEALQNLERDVNFEDRSRLIRESIAFYESLL